MKTHQEGLGTFQPTLGQGSGQETAAPPPAEPVIGGRASGPPPPPSTGSALRTGRQTKMTLTRLKISEEKPTGNRQPVPTPVQVLFPYFISVGEAWLD